MRCKTRRDVSGQIGITFSALGEMSGAAAKRGLRIASQTESCRSGTPVNHHREYRLFEAEKKTSVAVSASNEQQQNVQRIVLLKMMQL